MTSPSRVVIERAPGKDAYQIFVLSYDDEAMETRELRNGRWEVVPELAALHPYIFLPGNVGRLIRAAFRSDSGTSDGEV